MAKIFKIWGIRNRILKTEKSEIDLLQVLPHSFCSVHSHKNKINKFIVLEGELIIRTDFGNTILKDGESITIDPPIVHQFTTDCLKCQLIELAYVEAGTINPNDINRIKQGGRIIDGKELSLDEMKEKNLLKTIEKYNYYL